MAGSAEKPELKKYEVSATAKMMFFAMIGIGVVVTAAGFFADSDRAWHSYLTSYFYFTSVAVGGVFFCAIHNVGSAGWNVNVRRFTESLTSFLPVVAAGGIILILGATSLYEWLDHEHVVNDPILQGKASYLNLPFFIVRMVLFIGAWYYFGSKIIGASLKQDQDGDVKWTVANQKTSVIFLLIFAISYSLFAVDTLMSLAPHWFSTIFGVYCFAGLFQSTVAFTILFALYARKKGFVKGYVTMDHIHDLAKYLKGFTVFWAYIAFSQYMLIWYANLPEETIFFDMRSHGSWVYVSVALIIFKFIVPFIALLPRWAKRTPVHLVCVCLLILFMQYVDLFWLVYPNFDKDHVVMPWMEIGTFVGFLGLFLFMVTGFLSKNSLVPLKDPRIEESMHHHVTY